MRRSYTFKLTPKKKNFFLDIGLYPYYFYYSSLNSFNPLTYILLNILKKKQKNFYNLSLSVIKNKKKLQSNIEKNEYKNIIYYPSSSKEWFGNIYSFNKAYIKPLIVYDLNANKLFTSYFNIIQDKIRIVYKRRRSNRGRYSANKIYVSRPELKHTNTKLSIIIYIYNKQLSSIEINIRRFIIFTKKLYIQAENSVRYTIEHMGEITKLSKNKILISKYFYDKDDRDNYVLDHKGNRIVNFIETKWNRVVPLLKNNFVWFQFFNKVFFKITDNLFSYCDINGNIKNADRRSKSSMNYLKELLDLQEIFFTNAGSMNFNKSKFHQLFLNWNKLGLINIIQKIYGKKVEIKIIDLKSIHLNSDLFSSAIALKLRDRKNKAVNILRRSIIHMVKIPDLHTLITFDDYLENTDIKRYNESNPNMGMTGKNNIMGTVATTNGIVTNKILNNIKQQVVSGVRFEASGRLTRRLTAMRAVFKYRYVGSLKNIRSSFNNKSSKMLRGYVKSNSQYTTVNSKTRNGSFGLKGWVSSH